MISTLCLEVIKIIYCKDITKLNPELQEEAKGSRGRSIINKKIGSELVSLREISFFLRITEKTILGYYKFAEDKVNRKKFDLPKLPCYYKEGYKQSPKFWLRHEIYLIREFREWVNEMKLAKINLNMAKYRSEV